MPFLFASVLIPMGQVLVVGGLHLMAFRLLILVGWARLATSGLQRHPSTSGFALNSIDRAVIAWTCVYILAFTLLYSDVTALVNRVGFAYNAVGTYFLVRFLVHDSKDVDRVIKALAGICALLAIFMVIEQLTGRNLFSILGGVADITSVREGLIRSQGPFSHAIIAGTIGATLLPLFMGLWWAPRAKSYAVTGLWAGAVMALTSASATPLMSKAAGIVAMCFWPLRRKMRVFRWGLAFALVSLHVVMKAPVWSLIARVNVVGGSSGYHRYELVNQTILHFRDWWLLGAKDTEQWGYLMHDTANAFVDAAVTGGLLGLVLFIVILVRTFRCVGLARKAANGERQRQLRYWAWGSWLLATVVSFFGITYFDQSQVVWYSLLALVSVATISPGSGCCQTQYSLRAFSDAREPSDAAV